jgi:hypothetical protein
MEDINAYMLFVCKLANKESDEIFFNSSPAHAEIVLGTIFSKANKIVRIHSHSLNPIVTGGSYYLNELSAFFERGGKAKIILENKVTPDSKVQQLINKFSSQVELKEMYKSGIGRKDDDGNMVPVHFTTGDNNSYRIEHDVNGRIAECCFNSPSVVHRINNLFDSFFK